MDSKAALDKIKEAESNAQQIIERVKLDAHNILREAKLEKERVIKAAIEKAKIDSRKLRIKIQEEGSGEINEIKKQSGVEIETLKEQAKNNLDKAVEFIKHKIGA